MISVIKFGSRKVLSENFSYKLESRRKGERCQCKGVEKKKKIVTGIRDCFHPMRVEIEKKAEKERIQWALECHNHPSSKCGDWAVRWIRVGPTFHSTLPRCRRCPVGVVRGWINF